jgi:hypothetical protein
VHLQRSAHRTPEPGRPGDRLVASGPAFPRPVTADVRALGERCRALLDRVLPAVPVGELDGLATSRPGARPDPISHPCGGRGAYRGIGVAGHAERADAAAIRDTAVRSLFRMALDLHRLRPYTGGAGRRELDRLLDDVDGCIRRVEAVALADTAHG